MIQRVLYSQRTFNASRFITIKTQLANLISRVTTDIDAVQSMISQAMPGCWLMLTLAGMIIVML